MSTIQTQFNQSYSKSSNKFVDELLSGLLKDVSASELPVTGMAPLKLIFIPETVTPLDEYRKHLVEVGYEDELITEIIDGLGDTPLYEGQST